MKGDSRPRRPDLSAGSVGPAETHLGTATLADIARATHTSVSTVSRVLADSPAAQRISRETRERITLAARNLGYRPNLLARSLRTRKTHTVAVLVSDIANPWFGQLAGLMEQHLRRRGYSLIVCNSGEDESLENEYLRLLPQKGIDGLIIVPIATERETLVRYLPPGLPLVLVDRPIEGIPSNITTDQDQASRLLCDELTAIGVKRIAIVHGPEHVYTHRRRAQIARERFDVVVDHGGPAQFSTGRAAIRAITKARPDAVLCTNNFLGQGVLEGLEETSPLACFDEIPLMHLLPRPIVCCLQDVSRLAEESVDMLLQQLAGKPSPPRTLKAHIAHNPAFRRLRS